MSERTDCVSEAEEAGAFFGYPPCWVKWFAGATHLHRRAAAAVVGMGTGFLPCPQHWDALRSGTATLASLIVNRQCPLPFPRDCVMLNTLGTLRLPWMPPYPRATYPRWRRKQ